MAAETIVMRDTAGAPAAVSETWMPRGEYVDHMIASGIGDPVHVEAGQHLYAQGSVDHFFYVLVTGKVHVYNLSDEGHESSFNIMGPGSVIGEAAALTGLPRYSAARVLEPSQLLRVDTTRMEEYIARDARFVMGLLYVLSIKQRLAVDRLHQAVFDNPQQRVLKFLEQMASVHDAGGAGIVKVQLTHEQIGTLTNLSRVTVTRTLQQLKREGRIDVKGRAILLRPGAHASVGSRLN